MAESKSLLSSPVQIYALGGLGEVGKNLYCIENDKSLDKLDLATYRTFCELFDEDILRKVRVTESVEARKAIGGSAKSAVRENIRSLTKRLNKLCKD